MKPSNDMKPIGGATGDSLRKLHDLYNKHEISGKLVLSCASANDTEIYTCACGGMTGFRFTGWPKGMISTNAQHPRYIANGVDGFRAWYIHKTYLEMCKHDKGHLLIDWLHSNGQLHKYFTADGAMIVSDNDKTDEIYRGLRVVHAR